MKGMWGAVALRLERPALNRENPGLNPVIAERSGMLDLSREASIWPIRTG